MPIVSYSLVRSVSDAAGGSNVTFNYFDNLGGIYTESAYAPAGHDVDAKAAERMAELSEQLAESEMRNMLEL